MGWDFQTVQCWPSAAPIEISGSAIIYFNGSSEANAVLVKNPTHRVSHSMAFSATNGRHYNSKGLLAPRIHIIITTSGGD